MNNNLINTDTMMMGLTCFSFILAIIRTTQRVLKIVLLIALLVILAVWFFVDPAEIYMWFSQIQFLPDWSKIINKS